MTLSAHPDLVADPDRVRSILLLRTDSIGDGVLAASMLPHLKAAFPHAEINVVCQQHIVEIYEACPLVSNVIGFEQHRAFDNEGYRELIIQRLQSLRPDLALNPIFSREALCDLFAIRSGAPIRVAFHGNLCNISAEIRDENNQFYTRVISDDGSPKMELERHRDFLRGIGIEAPKLQPLFWIKEADEQFADDFIRQNGLVPERCIALFAGAQSHMRTYSHYGRALAQPCAEGDYTLLAFGTAAEYALNQENLDASGAPAINLSGKLTLCQTAALLKRCRLAVGSETGTAHIACAVGTPNVILMGGGHYGRFMPYSPLTSIVCLPLECFSCNWSCPFSRVHCVKDLHPDVITAAVRQALSETSDRIRVVCEPASQWLPLEGEPLWRSCEELLGHYPFVIAEADGQKVVPCAPKANQAGGRPAANAAAMRRQLEKPLPRITIVTPSFNQGSYLEECLDSVLSQNYPNLDYIVMDGGSTDGSVDIIKRYEKHLTFWQSKPDGGHYRAVNDGFGRSTGEIMAWLNSDDKYHPGSLRLVADAFRSFPELPWITGSPTGWDATGAIQYIASEIPLWSREKYLRGEIGPPHIQQESTFWRRSLWDAAGETLDTELDLAADMELWARFFRHAQLTTLHAPLGGFRSHPDQKTASLLERYNAEAARVIERERRFYQSSGTPHLVPAPAPLQVADVEARAHTSVTAENFGAFTYSRTFHFAYFAGKDLELYGAPANPANSDLKVYQDLLAYSFIRHNVPRGARILEVGGGASRVLRAIRDDYECWNLDKLEGLGNGPVAVQVEGFTLIRDYLGSFSEALPDGYFDLVFSISVLEHVEQSEEQFDRIRADLDRLLKPGGWSLHCFDVVAKGPGKGVWTNALLPYLFEKNATVNHFVPMEELYADPFVYAMSEAAYDTHWKPMTKIPFREHGFPLSYNVLWQKPLDAGAAPVVAEPAPVDTGAEKGYLVSAIVSTYNAGRFFRGCLENLLRQTLYAKGELEIIVIDSGSQENEGEIAREFMERHPHIVYRRTERETLYAAWNRGIALARGRFLTHANTDDRHRADAFELMARELEQSGAGLAYVDALMTCEPNETFEQNSATKQWLLPDFDLRQALLDCPFGCQVMWRADVHREIGGFDPQFKRAGDYEFFFRLALHRGALHIPEIVSLYYESIDNLSYQAPQEVIREVRGFIGAHRKEIPLEEIYPFLKQDRSPAARVAALVDFGNLLMGSSGSIFTDLAMAEKCYRKALELNPGRPELADNLAVAAMAQGKREAALEAIALSHAETPRLKRYLGELRQGRIPSALDLLRIPHPGLDAMPPVKLFEQLRVPILLSGPAQRREKGAERTPGVPTIVVDGVFFMTAKTGITRVWEALLAEWGRSEFGKSVLVLDRIGTAPKFPGLRYRTLPAYSATPEGRDRALLQQVCDEEGADLFISTYYSAPLTTPSLFLSHDMIPEMSGLYDLQDAQWREKRNAMGRASLFVAVSRSTANNMEKLHPELAGRIEVAHCGIDRDLFHPASADEMAAFRNRHNIGKPFFLFVGKRTEHKNGKLLFQAFSRLPDRERLAIVCVGGAPQLEQELSALVQGCEVHLVSLPDQDLRVAYSCAEALVYPSTHEGFGLPLLEAMACRCPVITCRNTSIPEVAGDAAIYVDPDNAAEMAAALTKVRLPDVRDSLIGRGCRQAAGFSWDKMARTIQEIICRHFAPATDALPPTGAATARTGSATCPANTGSDALPKISLVIPSYNYGHFLKDCLESILSQGYPNLELIVLDGGSTDDTIDVIKRYEKHIAFWRSHKDAGQYAAVEEGLNRATGEVMTWLNADDMFHPGAFDAAGRIFAQCPEVEWLMGRPNSFDAEGRQKHVLSHLPLNSRTKYLADEEFIQQEGVFWRRTLWQRSGAYIDKTLPLAADLELWARFFRSARLFSVDQMLAGFRDHPLQKSKDKAGYTAEADRVLARERELFAAEKTPFNPPAPLPILIQGDRVIL